MKTWKLQLRVSCDTAEQEEAIKSAIIMQAKHMLATAMLVSPPGRPPEIVVESDDFFAGREQIELAEVSNDHSCSQGYPKGYC